VGRPLLCLIDTCRFTEISVSKSSPCEQGEPEGVQVNAAYLDLWTKQFTMSVVKFTRDFLAELAKLF
jgi:hypothetical protein